MLVKQVLWGVVLPALVTAVVLLAACRPWRRPRSGPGAWVGAMGLGAGYVTGHLALFGWPGLTPKESWQWMPHIAAAVATAGILIASARVPRRMGWGIAVLVAIGAGWLLVPRWQEARLVWTVVLASVAMAMWMVMHAMAERTTVVSASVIVLVAALVAALVLERAATARFVQLAGALAASAGGCLVVAPLVSSLKLGPGLAGMGAVLLVGLMFTGHFNHFSDIPAICFFLVMAAPLMAWVGQLGPIRRRKAWQRLAFEVAAVLVPGAVAVGLAFAATDSNG